MKAEEPYENIKKVEKRNPVATQYRKDLNKIKKDA